MQLHIFTVYDQKAKAHLPPFFLPELGQAIRTFGDCVNSNDHQFGKHPSDYTLIEIGEFDDTTGQLSPHDLPIVHGTGVEFIQITTPPNQTDIED